MVILTQLLPNNADQAVQIILTTRMQHVKNIVSMAMQMMIQAHAMLVVLEDYMQILLQWTVLLIVKIIRLM